MNVLIIDDEPMVLKDTMRVVERALKEEYANEIINIFTCQKASEVLNVVDEVNPDIIFSDIDMPGINGLELSRKIEKKKSDINLIFLTGFPKYGIEAWNTNASGFLLKPVAKKDIKEALTRLRNPIKAEKDKLEITCFGAFEIRYKGRIITFKRKKSLELFAVLVDACGAEVSNEKIRCMLWEEEEDSREKNSYIRTLVKELRDTLRENGIEDVVINTNGGYMIDKNTVICDYFECAGNVNFTKPSQYMSQYYWAN